jgi:hypothetical protein
VRRVFAIDIKRLERWIVKAASCTQAAELFTDG